MGVSILGVLAELTGRNSGCVRGKVLSLRAKPGIHDNGVFYDPPLRKNKL